MPATGGVIAAHGYALEGSLGIIYKCGEATDGELRIHESALGKKVRSIYGGYDQVVALVDAWEWECQQNASREVVMELATVAEGLQDVKIHQVAIGKSHRLVLSLDGQIFSWGARDMMLSDGELGRAKRTVQEKYHQTSPETPEVGQAQLPDGSDEQQQQPARVHASKDLYFVKIACGRNHSAALTDKGDLYTWGRNFEGQLGHVFPTLSKERNTMLNGICAWPKYVSFFLSKPRIVDVSCGELFTVVLLENGSIYSFGERFTGVTHHPEAKTNANPRLLISSGSDGQGFVGIACGFSHALAVTASGELFAWGLNLFGQLGLGKQSGVNSIPAPTSLGNPRAWAKVFAGANYSAALTISGQLFMWGNAKYGKLGHGNSNDRCEFEPKCVEQLTHTYISSVVCGQRNMFAFAPTHVSGIWPKCGDITGGYNLRIRGSGFWVNDDLTVRFVPLTEGRLSRGSIGVFSEETQEIICQVPKFNLSGEFAVEVSMNGKHFTTNGCVFTVYKRPLITSISFSDVRLERGEELSLILTGNLPAVCRHPIIRFSPCVVDEEGKFLEMVNDSTHSRSVVGTFDDYSEQQDPYDRILRFVTPTFECKDEILPCVVEISYNEGEHFTLVTITNDADPSFSENDASTEASDALPYVVWFHDAYVLRVRPNSFLMPALPQTIEVDTKHLLPTRKAISAILHVNLPDASFVDVALEIQKFHGNTITCVIPPLSTWNYTPNSSIIENTKGIAQQPSNLNIKADWWTRFSRTGFTSQLRLSMNSNKSFVPSESESSAQIFAFASLGRLTSLFPTMGMLSGGTSVAIAGDFFHFDTEDVIVSVVWRDKHFHVPAVCIRNPSDPSDRRVIFQTPPLPFPNDLDTAAAIAEGMVMGTREEVDVFVALDGSHYTDKSLQFVYCPVPILLDIAPSEAEPGTRMTLKVDKLVGMTRAWIKLTTVSMGVSTVIPVDVNESSSSLEFNLPHLPVPHEDHVNVTLSVNSQEFVDNQPGTFSETNEDSNTGGNGGLHFRYKGQVH